MQVQGMLRTGMEPHLHETIRPINSSFATRLPGDQRLSYQGSHMRATLCIMAIAAAIGSAANAAGPAAKPTEPDAALVDAIVRKLESSGALDAAVGRAIDRQVQRQQQAAQAEEAQRQAQLQAQAKSARPVDDKQDHIRGNSSAEVSLIEYSDFECPFCKQFHGTPKALLDRYP